MMHRRGFISGLGALIAAPAIIKYSNLMPVKSIVDDGVALFNTAHPMNSWGGDLGTAADLNEESLKQLIIEVKKSYEPEVFRMYNRNFYYFSNAGLKILK